MPGRRGQIIPPSETDAVPSMPEHGQHPFDAMLEAPPVKELKMDFKVPPRQPVRDDEVPEGFVKTKAGNLANIITKAGGPTQPQYNFFVDLIESKDMLRSPRFEMRMEGTCNGDYGAAVDYYKYLISTGTRKDCSAMIDALLKLPNKQAPQSEKDSGGERGRFRVKYHEVTVDGGRQRRIGYLTDQPEAEQCSWAELANSEYLRIPECKFALDTSKDERFANDVTFFHLWIGDRRGWKLFMYKSDDELVVPVGKAVPLLRRFAEDMEGGLKLYGDEYSRCGICNRKLTKDESRARGIGPVCAENWL
jgi:hypothetical protein